VWVLVSAWFIDQNKRIERGGWMANHPITGHPTHVVTREWFDSIEAENKRLKRQIEDVREAVNDLHNAGSDPAVLRVIESALDRIPESKEAGEA